MTDFNMRATLIVNKFYLSFFYFLKTSLKARFINNRIEYKFQISCNLSETNQGLIQLIRPVQI